MYDYGPFIFHLNTEDTNSQHIQAINALCAGLDLASGGRVTYETATSGPLIAKTDQEITLMFPKVSFSASWVIVITWENVSFLSLSPLVRSNTKVFSLVTLLLTINNSINLILLLCQFATLQVVLVSDGGRHSFILMNYGTTDNNSTEDCLVRASWSKIFLTDQTSSQYTRSRKKH